MGVNLSSVIFSSLTVWVSSLIIFSGLSITYEARKMKKILRSISPKTIITKIVIVPFQILDQSPNICFSISSLTCPQDSEGVTLVSVSFV
ncbi:unnamed protein product [Meloidogyne enterolobii]|uniref:Uncharacterized protein n=1 Tax=Meloidogyne enterolobii TaxID=390850 RepID=A0ACB0YZM4_MELEN